jgi:3'-5' exonuclease
VPPRAGRRRRINGSLLLEYGAMRHKLAMPQYLPELHNPYALDDLSLCDILSPSSNRRISLRQLCAVVGLHYDGLDDDEVAKYFRQNRVFEITESCKREVVNIFRIWLRWELFSGRLSQHGFQRSEANLEGFFHVVSA